ncbi:GMC oxidoreductase [Thiorhodovibrio frisius]|uniref:GMC oxidoreductase n=1 Tax=Thiorhodovibrio frisius TaxID=631362 RepID=UPI000255EBFF|nr:GMC family oxidoreductase [Thiorhodovibrio frisius]
MANEQVYDFIVVGTGAGGGIVAYRLAKAGFRVLSVEQGPRLPENYFSAIDPPGTRKDWGIRPEMSFPTDSREAIFRNALFAQPQARATSRAAERSFLSYQVNAVGGLQNLWNGVSVRFAPQDFGGWPISYSDLAPHYSDTEKLVTVCGTREGIGDLPDGEYIPPKPLRPADELVINAIHGMGRPHTYVIPNRKAIETRADRPNACVSTGICTSGCMPNAMYKFSTRLLPEIESLPNYELRPNCKAIRLALKQGSSEIESLTCLDTQSGEQLQLKARHFILAGGALETPRLLLNSACEQAPEGLANRSGTLGRYLQDNAKVAFSTALLKLWGKPAAPDVGYGDLLILVSRGQLPDGSEFSFCGHAIQTVLDTPYYLEGLRKFPRAVRPWLARKLFNSYLTLAVFAPGDPDPDNRITRSAETDAHGIPQVDIQYRYSERTLQMLDEMDRFVRKALRRCSGTLLQGGRDRPGTGIHYAGSTRMSSGAEDGVVDRNLRTHDHPNLYIADGGVVPTLPDKHVTLTIMSLASRLADHLLKQDSAA